MPDYRRAWHPGGTYFSPSPCCNGMATTVREIALLHRVVAKVIARHPFRIHGWVGTARPPALRH